MPSNLNADEYIPENLSLDFPHLDFTDCQVVWQKEWGQSWNRQTLQVSNDSATPHPIGQWGKHTH